jgi:hypothetical protein
MRSTITAQPGLHSLYNTGSGGATVLAGGLATGFTVARFTARFTGRARRLEERVVRVRVARMLSLPPSRLIAPAGFCVVSRSTLGALVQDRAPSKNAVSFQF